jgi:hypothetical protein
MRLLLNVFVGIIIGSAGILTAIWLEPWRHDQPAMSVSDLTPPKACLVPEGNADQTTKDAYQACLNSGGVSIQPPGR